MWDMGGRKAASCMQAGQRRLTNAGADGNARANQGCSTTDAGRAGQCNDGGGMWQRACMGLHGATWPRRLRSSRGRCCCSDPQLPPSPSCPTESEQGCDSPTREMMLREMEMFWESTMVSLHSRGEEEGIGQ